MATIYVRSTDGSNADNGSTWALAKATLAGADGIDAAGDTIYVSQAHAESTATTVTLNFAGTPANPNKILCGDDAAAPPTALATTAKITVTSNATLYLQGSFYAYGLIFVVDGTTRVAYDAATALVQRYEQCSFRSTNTGSAGSIWLGSGSNISCQTVLKDCTFKPSASGQKIYIYGKVRMDGVSWVSGLTSPATLFSLALDRTGCDLLATNLDMTNLSSSINLFDGAVTPAGTGIIRNSKLPPSWTGALVSGSIPGPGARYELHNCDSADTNYRLWAEDYAGSIKSETTIVRTGGATDGTTAVSWKMASSANARYPTVLLVSFERAVWNSTTGSSVTATVEIVTDGVTLKDDECWIEVEYLGNGSYPLGTWINDAKVDVLAAAANQASSSETWTTTGLTTPVKQKLYVTFTPQEAGYIVWRVVLAKASATVYVDPYLTVA